MQSPLTVAPHLGGGDLALVASVGTLLAIASVAAGRRRQMRVLLLGLVFGLAPGVLFDAVVATSLGTNASALEYVGPILYAEVLVAGGASLTLSAIGVARRFL